MLSVVTCKWTPRSGYRSQYGPETVNTLQRMVARWYPDPHRFVCVTDDPTGIDSSVSVLPLWPDFADLPSPHGGKNPSCYRRLKLYAPEMADLIGQRFVALDLVSRLLDPANDGPFGDRFAHLRHYDVNGHSGRFLITERGGRRRRRR